MKNRVIIALTVGVALLAMTGLTASSAPAPNWDVSGAWSGNSGLTGNLAYHFNMTLTQHADGTVTGDIEYTNASPKGIITGYVSGNDFYFTRQDTNQNYSATCWPCMISADGTHFHGYGTGPGQNVEWEAWGQATRLVMIDIKPGSDPNCINPDGHGVIPVAILTTADFDAAWVDPSSVTLEGSGVRVKGKSGNAGSLEDVDWDGDYDLVVQIYDDTVLAGKDAATLTGLSYGGMPIKGTDSICVVP